MAIEPDPKGFGPGNDSLTRPDPRRNSRQILAWAICWPWSLLWTVVANNPFCSIFEFVAEEFRSALDHISSGTFRGIEDDLLLISRDESSAGQSAVDRESVSTSLPGQKEATDANGASRQLAESNGQVISNATNSPSLPVQVAQDRTSGGAWTPPEPARSHRLPHEISWYSSGSRTPTPVVSPVPLQSGLTRAADGDNVGVEAEDVWDSQLPASPGQ